MAKPSGKKGAKKRKRGAGTDSASERPAAAPPADGEGARSGASQERRRPSRRRKPKRDSANPVGDRGRTGGRRRVRDGGKSPPPGKSPDPSVAEGGEVERRWQPPKIDELKEETERDTIRIIKRIQAGETHLIRQLINRYRAQVAGIAYKMVGDYDDAKDIAQMVFVKTYYNIHRFDTTKRFSTWLYRIAVNAAIDYIRKFKKQRYEELDESRETMEHKQPNPEQAFQLKELRNHVLQAADKLNEKQRMAFVLKDLEGLDINEISQIMGMPQATVRWYLHRARKKLRADLQRRYGPILNRLGLAGD